LLFGTTGEGPSFSPHERVEALRVAAGYCQAHPEFRLLAGTGTPSLQETIQLTRAAFELVVEAVVVLPPYYYRKVGDEGLLTWFQRVIQEAVPAGKTLPPGSGFRLI
jgi:4-hydroxy-tetrahydrodipicolinate synthase